MEEVIEENCTVYMLYSYCDFVSALACLFIPLTANVQYGMGLWDLVCVSRGEGCV